MSFLKGDALGAPVPGYTRKFENAKKTLMSLDKLLNQYGAAHKDPRNKFFHKLGIPMIIVSIIALLISGGAAWAWWVFGIGWAFQFVGHAFERTWPEFMKNPIFLLIGPLYFVREIRRRKQAPEKTTSPRYASRARDSAQS